MTITSSDQLKKACDDGRLDSLVRGELGDIVAEGDLWFAGGSIAEGFGNCTSDLDIIVIKADNHCDVNLDSKSVSMGDHVVYDLRFEGQRVDMEVRPLKSVQTKLQRLTECINTDSLDSLAFSRGDLEFFNDLQNAIPIFNGAALEDLLEMAPEGSFALQLMEYSNAATDSLIEDCVGALQAGDVGAALISSEAALGCAADCLASAWGATNPKPKWRLRRLERAGLLEQRTEYLRALCLTGISDAEILDASRARLSVSQSFIAAAHLKRMMG